MLLSQIKLHIARRSVAHHAVPDIVFHSPFSAMVNGEDSLVWYIAAMIPLHMKVIEAQQHTRKYLVGSHSSVTGFIAELPDRTAVTLSKQNCPFIFKFLCMIHSQSPLKGDFHCINNR